MRILIIQGHPDSESYNWALAQVYQQAAIEAGHSVKRINVSELDFNPNLQYGYRKRTELEPDLIQAQQDILWSEHIVLVSPIWWGSLPAILKGFFDRVFLPGFAFEKIENSKVRWKRLLKGRSARIICTADQPAWFYWVWYKRPSYNALKKLTFEFVGISPVKATFIGPIRLSSNAFREQWLKKVSKLGNRGL